MSSIPNAIQGLDELKRKLRELAPKAERKVLRAAWLRSANTIRDAARQKAPVEAGELKKSIKTLKSRGIRFKVGPTVRAPVPKGIRGSLQEVKGASGGKSIFLKRVAGRVREVKGYPYGAAVEFGHSFPGGRRDTIASGQRFGTDVKPHPYMRPAWHENKDKVLKTFSDEAGKGIEKVAAEKA